MKLQHKTILNLTSTVNLTATIIDSLSSDVSVMQIIGAESPF